MQRLQRRFLDAPDTFTDAWNWIDAYLRLEHGDTPLYRFLRQALMARRALILLDGIDEGGQSRAAIETHIHQVLVPQGHLIVMTSRPAVTMTITSGSRRRPAKASASARHSASEACGLPMATSSTASGPSFSIFQAEAMSARVIAKRSRDVFRRIRQTGCKRHSASGLAAISMCPVSGLPW